MFKKIYIIIILIMIFLPECKDKAKNVKSTLPNVVVIVIDTLRADHLPFYGYPENTTPFLSSLTKKGVLFERAFSTSSWTAPATASIFTSMYPFQHRVVSNMLATLNFNEGLEKNYKIKLNKIPEDITTLAEIFKNKGYATYGVADNVNIGKKEGFEQGFDKLKTYNYQTAYVVNDTILSWEKEIKSKDRYFLYIQYMDPHTPLRNRKNWFKNRKTPKYPFGKPISFKEEDLENSDIIDSYDSEINLVDLKIEELYNQFKWDKNTLIIVTADHGEELWDHGAFGHGYSLYTEVIKVPLLFYYPDGNFKVNRIKQNTSILDILPTLREMIKLPEDKMNEGVSLLNILKNGEKNESNNRVLFSHLLKRKIGGKRVKNNAEAYSVIYKEWHYIKSLPNLEKEYDQFLFNIEKDLFEKNDLFEELSSQKIIKKLKNYYFNFYKKCRKFKPNTSVYISNKKEMERIKTLGYVE